MGYIDNQQIQLLKDKIDIVDVISHYVSLKQAGANFKGLCPFHNEKTPSFSVNRDKQYFKCFGCGEGGDAIGFIQKMENLSYIETIKFLADMYGIVLEETEYNTQKNNKRQRLFEINGLAARFYMKNFYTDEVPQKYVKDREITNKSMISYFLGYAKNDNGLYRYLKNKNVKEEEMLELGLISGKNGRYYDRFRDRLIFPILNNKEQVIGFGARTIINHDIKYLNSPESPIFIKGENLYGIHIVKKKRKKDRIILVEGYMDVIGLYNHGIDYSMASLGTALTLQQANLIKRYANEVYIAYDGDEAGIKATLRAIEIFKNINIQLGILEFPDKMDPDEYIKKYGKDKFFELLKNAKNPMDFKLEKLSEKAPNKMEFIKEITDFLAEIDSNVIRDIYIDKTAKHISVHVDALRKDVDEKIKIIKNKKIFNNDLVENKNYKSLRNNIDNKDDISINLQKEIIMNCIISEKRYELLTKNYIDLVKEAEFIDILEKIKELYENKQDINNIFEENLFKENILNKKSILILKETNDDIILEEMVNRIERFKLSKRKIKLQEMLKTNFDEDLLKEYNEILKKLT